MINNILVIDRCRVHNITDQFLSLSASLQVVIIREGDGSFLVFANRINGKRPGQPITRKELEDLAKDWHDK